MAKVWICYSCGTLNDLGERICVDCGYEKGYNCRNVDKDNTDIIEVIRELYAIRKELRSLKYNNKPNGQKRPDRGQPRYDNGNSQYYSKDSRGRDNY